MAIAKNELRDAIIAFEHSERTITDYMKLIYTVERAFRQGSGLGGREIIDEVTEGVQKAKSR